MRAVTKQAVTALINRREMRNGNTVVIGDNNGSLWLKLHSNPIAELNVNNTLSVTNAGWFTNTTKERLNGLPGVKIRQVKGEWLLNGIKWDGDWIVIGKVNNL